MTRQVVLIAASVWLGLAASAAALGRAAGDPVRVDGGEVAGVWRENAAVRAYLAIPFAAPPLGDLRWKPPQPAIPWGGVRAARAPGPACLQRPARAGSLNGEIYGQTPQSQPTQSEDCLTLNVWAPAEKVAGGHPVLVWIYGGSFTHGTASLPLYDGARLARRGVVMVSFNYRTGALGFLSHPELSTEGEGASGNYGFMDQVAALRWVRRNVAAFGGDPGNVTIFGQSAGAGGVVVLMASPMARGLFHKAIAESLGIFNLQPLAEGEANGVAIGRALGAFSLAAMRGLPAERFIEPGIAAAPVIDGRVAVEPLAAAFEAGRAAAIPLLTGWNSDEGGTYPTVKTKAAFADLLRFCFGANAERAAALFPARADADVAARSADLTRDLGFAAGIYKAAALQARRGQPVYLYHFDRRSPFFAGQVFNDAESMASLGAYHSAEIPYVFGNLEAVERAFEPADRTLSERMQSYWVNFAASGDPNRPAGGVRTADLPKWPRYLGDGGEVLYLGGTIRTGPAPDRARLDFINSVPVRTPGGN